MYNLANDFRAIPNFPNYVINAHGEVWNLERQRPMAVSVTMQGNKKVSLTVGDHRRTLSVARLVAEAFVEVPNHRCTEVIILNDIPSDVRADNLAWRPPRFAWKYARQMRETDLPLYYFNVPVFDVTTGINYPDIKTAAVTHGLLFEDIWRSATHGTTVYPTNSVYGFVL